MTGGLRADQLNASWPFAKLTVTREKITLRVFSNEYEIEKRAVITLKKHKGIFSRGLNIVHDKNEIPGRLIFWTFNFSKLKLVMEQMGYDFEA